MPGKLGLGGCRERGTGREEPENWEGKAWAPGGDNREPAGCSRELEPRTESGGRHRERETGQPAGAPCPPHGEPALARPATGNRSVERWSPPATRQRESPGSRRGLGGAGAGPPGRPGAGAGRTPLWSAPGRCPVPARPVGEQRARGAGRRQSCGARHAARRPPPLAAPAQGESRGGRAGAAPSGLPGGSAGTGSGGGGGSHHPTLPGRSGRRKRCPAPGLEVRRGCGQQRAGPGSSAPVPAPPAPGARRFSPPALSIPPIPRGSGGEMGRGASLRAVRSPPGAPRGPFT